MAETRNSLTKSLLKMAFFIVYLPLVILGASAGIIWSGLVIGWRAAHELLEWTVL